MIEDRREATVDKGRGRAGGAGSRSASSAVCPPSFDRASWCRRTLRYRGLTLLEMSIAMAISSLLFLAIAGVLAANHKSFNQTYKRVFGDVVNDAYTARRTFEGIIRKASADYTNCTASSVEVHYYSAAGAATLDHKAIFTYSAGDKTLTLARGDLNSNPAGAVIARNVTSCTFEQIGPCIAMALVLDDSTTNQTVAVTATRHN